MATTKPLKVALAGCGAVSVVHFEAIQALEQQGLLQLVAVCDTDPGVLREAAERYAVPGFLDHASMLSAVTPDVIHVCTPHDQHAPVVLAGLAAGSHVLVEKPLAHTVADAQRIVDAAARHPELKVGVCFQNRYNTTIQAMRDLLETGSLGEIVGGAATVVWHRTPEYYREKPWRGMKSRSGGGVLINQAIHTVDLLQWLLGEVWQVAGSSGQSLIGASALGTDVEDTAHLILDHENGARSVMFATVAGATDFPVSLEIVTRGAVLALRDDLIITGPDGRTSVIKERRAESGGRSYWGVSHALLINDFYRRLPEPQPFWIGPEQAMASLRIISQVI